MEWIDLHVHTRFSDGSDTPEELFNKALGLGLKAVAITDHDCTDGLAALPPAGLERINGVELNTEVDGQEVHVLGYFFDPAALNIRERAERDRNERNTRILDLLAEKEGIVITLEELRSRKPVGTLGRPHIADALVQRGLFPDRFAAFAAWLDAGRPYFVPRRYFTLEEAAECIRNAGGRAVLAHPLQYKLAPNALRALVRRCRDAGFSGLEAYYSGYAPAEREMLCRAAADCGLLVTGGSDYHGPQRADRPLGGVRVPYAFLEALREAD